jgi:hypothetical protein
MFVFDRSGKCNSEPYNKVLNLSQNICWSHFCQYICSVKRITVILLTSLVLSTNLIVGIDTVYCCCLKVMESHLSFCKSDEDCSKIDPCASENSCPILKKSACKTTTTSSLGLSVNFEQQFKSINKDYCTLFVDLSCSIPDIFLTYSDNLPATFITAHSNFSSLEFLQVFRC